MEELLPCCSQRSGVRDIRLGTVCFGLEESTTKILWHRWGGRGRYCWWRRWSLGTGNLQLEATLHSRTQGSGKMKNFETAITIIYTTRQSVPMRTEKVLLIWHSSEKTCPDHRCSCGGLMEKRKWPTPKLSFMVMEICCELCAVNHSRCRERERVPRVKSPTKLREPVDETSMPVTTTTTVT